MSEPCELEECDVLMSHGWKDNGEMKWAALVKWCDDFIPEHGRSQQLWLDKACIDQGHIGSAQSLSRPDYAILNDCPVEDSAVLTLVIRQPLLAVTASKDGTVKATAAAPALAKAQVW